MADIFEISGRIHSTSQEEVVTTADEILATQDKKQSEVNQEVQSELNAHDEAINAPSTGLEARVETLEEQVAFSGDFQTANTPADVVSGSGKITTANAVAAIAKQLKAEVGYYPCTTAAGTAAKVISASDAPNYVLTVGGSVKVKMTNRNTAANPTLKIGNAEAKPLYYGASRASSSNTWEAGEVIEVYYDGENLMANNVEGGGGYGVFDISAYNASGEPLAPAVYNDLTAALGTNGENVPASKRKGGMSVKFILQLFTIAKSTSKTQPTGTELQSDPVIAAGTKYKASDLSAFATLPITDPVAYYISDGEATPTYTIYTISKNAVADCEYMQYRYMRIKVTYSAFVNVTNWQGVDETITAGSKNLVTSGGVQNELALGAVYDVSAHNGGTTFDSLSALLSDANLNTLIPTAERKGGMSIKFVQSSDNKYVQYRLMHPLDNPSTAAADFANTANWQGVDTEPTAGSRNLVESGGVLLDLIDLGFDVPLIQGVLSSTTGEYVSSRNNRVCANIFLKAPIEVKVTGDYQFRYSVYNIDGSFVYNNAYWLKEVNIEDTSYIYKFFFRKSDDSIITPIQVKPYVEIYQGLKYNKGVETELVDLGADVSLVQGTIDTTTGQNDYYTVSMVSTDIFISAPLKVKTRDQFQFRYASYNLDKTFIDLSGSWLNEIDLTDKTKLYKILFRKSDNSNIVPSDVIAHIEILTGFKYYDDIFAEQINNLEEEIDEGSITFVEVRSANIHNSAEPTAATSPEPTNGSDWLGHVLHNPAYADTGAIDENSRYATSYYIPVEYGIAYKSNAELRRAAFYKSDYSYIVGSTLENVAANSSISIPQNAAFVRISYDIVAYISPKDVKFGKYDDDINVPYYSEINDYDSRGKKLVTKEMLDEVVNKNTLDIAEKGISFVREESANIHNSAPTTSATSPEPTDGSDWAGHSINPQTGLPAENELYNCSYYIDVIAGASYKSTVELRRICYYDSEKTFKSSVDNVAANSEIVVPSGVTFCRLMYYVQNPDNVRFGLYSENVNVPYYVAINDYDSKGRRIALYDDIPQDTEKKEIKILLLGSSLGVNTIVQFPFLSNSCGIKTVCGNMYMGSGTLAQWAEKCSDNISVDSAIYTSDTDIWTRLSRPIDQMLDYADWDIIILQRGAAECDTWTSEQSAALGTIIDHIRSYTDYAPRIMFNSTYSRSIGNFASRQAQIDFTKNVMITAKAMQDEYGIEVIPTAIAIQNARNTLLAQYGSYDNTIPDLSCDVTHLDTGIGSYILGCLIVEQILSPMYNVSMIAKDYFPTQAKVVSRGVFTSSRYTPPTGITNYFRIANACALAAVREPWQLNKVLLVKYPMPDTDPTQLDLDIDYTGL